MTGAPAIHIVDDDASFRSAVSRLLKVSGYDVAEYDSAAGFLRAVADARPGCLLLDVEMPSFTGLQLQEELTKLAHDWPIIFMTGHGDIQPAYAPSRPALTISWLNPCPGKRCCRQSKLRWPGTQNLGEPRPAQHFQGTDRLAYAARSRSLLQMVRGKLNKQIAHSLGTSERTIKAHRHMVMQKLQVQSFAEAVSIAERLGLTALPSPPA